MSILGGEEMELGKQIKKHRQEVQLSQEKLADRVYVSRQTISNWENDKSYPDVNSLVLLSEIFQISPSILILIKKSYFRYQRTLTSRFLVCQKSFTFQVGDIARSLSLLFGFTTPYKKTSSGSTIIPREVSRSSLCFKTNNLKLGK